MARRADRLSRSGLRDSHSGLLRSGGADVRCEAARRRREQPRNDAPSRAKSSASVRSLLRSLRVINCTRCGLATITSIRAACAQRLDPRRMNAGVEHAEVADAIFQVDANGHSRSGEGHVLHSELSFLGPRSRLVTGALSPRRSGGPSFHSIDFAACTCEFRRAETRQTWDHAGCSTQGLPRRRPPAPRRARPRPACSNTPAIRHCSWHAIVLGRCATTVATSDTSTTTVAARRPRSWPSTRGST